MVGTKCVAEVLLHLLRIFWAVVRIFDYLMSLSFACLSIKLCFIKEKKMIVPYLRAMARATLKHDSHYTVN